jgi:hypothetical protein
MNRNPQNLASCANCWFNGLQQGTVGLDVGYCVEHRVVLVRSNETTCARHMRKDLLLHSATNFNSRHRLQYSDNDHVQKIIDRSAAQTAEFVETDTGNLRKDPVGELVSDYGEYGSKIESLARLSNSPSMRSEIAMISLGRGYVNRCIRRNGTWKSGLHLFWWMRRKLAEGQVPDVVPSDIRYIAANSLSRQIELAQWSLLMFRLAFISDIGIYAERTAKDDEQGISALKDLAELAAEETGSTSLRKLTRWVKVKCVPLLDEILPEHRYRELGAALRQQPD